ncbi:phosphoglycerate mutase-like protein [Dothidotthia symphoricarpi CBS 119687]|uniref:3-phytase n=1 Tax=Dothidotthia symphoricarpi CBS 119687 TaxID=1392245 RepID=A0A6A6A1L9_9PLEO|nr:phosphoglycerate mutase-like protein [Dothidotthia symphoricarpi CBS 119687]KAF2124847.1 phosphoglycerate mutase-like protein [Dothidotthia symphoricarpi CBS 119687]
MTTFIPRNSYSEQELETLFPKELELQLVQILLRHGERTPVSPRFQNAGLKPYWPYCNAARQLASVIMTTKDLDTLKYNRKLETFGTDDAAVLATGPGGEYDAICQPGELTDKGRHTTLTLGLRLRHLYVDQLQFMPKILSDGDTVYLRATPMPRALESVQQAFYGFYPPSARTENFPAPTIITRTPADETLFPNDANCRRFSQLSRAFAQRAADNWNDTEDMQYLSKLYSKWMPGEAKVAVDSHPRISGIMDTINATDAHGPATKLPKEFYDPKARAIIDKIAVEEWFKGYADSSEYRMLGVGALMGDITARMTASVHRNGKLLPGRSDEADIKLALSGCHDTTLAAALTSLGAFGEEKWPPFTSHIAFELFRKRGAPTLSKTIPAAQPKSQSWWSSLFGSAKAGIAPSEPVARKPIAELTEAQRDELKEYYVRVRYNDKIMQVPACKSDGKHLQGDTTFCTLDAFKSVVDQYTPKSWKAACGSNLDASAFPVKPEPAGLE